MQPGIMMHADLGDAMPAQLELPHQLHADGSAGRAELHLVEQRAADQAEVAVDVAQVDAKNQARESVVQISDCDAMPWVAPLQLVSVDSAHLRRHQIEQLRQLAYGVLPIPVGVQNEVLARGGESAAQRHAVAAL